jgi:hypothetical protein
LGGTKVTKEIVGELSATISMKMTNRVTKTKCSSFGPSNEERCGIVFVTQQVSGPKTRVIINNGEEI